LVQGQYAKAGVLLYATANCQREQFQNNSRRAFALGVKLPQLLLQKNAPHPLKTKHHG